MKNLIKSFGLLSMGLALVACNKEIETPEAPVQGQTIQITAAAGEFTPPASTKLAFYDDGGMKWQAGDMAGLAISGHESVSSFPIDTKEITNGKAATFYFESVDATGPFRIFYPYNNYSKSSYYGTDAEPGKYFFEIPAAQTQAEAGESLSGVIPVIAENDITLDTEGYKHTYIANTKTLASLLRFNVYGKAGEKVQSVAVAATNVAGGIKANNAGEVSRDGEHSNEAKVTLTNHYTTAAAKGDGTKNGIFLAVIPGSYENPVYTVVTNRAIYTFESSKTHNWDVGKFYEINLNLSNENAQADYGFLNGHNNGDDNWDNYHLLKKKDGVYYNKQVLGSATTSYEFEFKVVDTWYKTTWSGYHNNTYDVFFNDPKITTGGLNRWWLNHEWEQTDVEYYFEFDITGDSPILRMYPTEWFIIGNFKYGDGEGEHWVKPAGKNSTGIPMTFDPITATLTVENIRLSNGNLFRFHSKLSTDWGNGVQIVKVDNSIAPKNNSDANITYSGEDQTCNIVLDLSKWPEVSISYE